MQLSKTSDISVHTGEMRLALMLLRFALAAGLLSAVADRFGLWGPRGMPLVAWGSFPVFLTYTAKLNPWCPATLIPALGWTATITEVVLGLALISGFRLRQTGAAVAVLTTIFAVAMTLTLGVEAPLNYSVFSFAASAYVLTCAYRGNTRTFTT